MRKFEQLTVWQIAREMNKSLGGIFYKGTFKNRSFQDQIMKAAQSIPNNIAEGHESGSDKKFVRFLRYAKGSSAEVRSMLYSALDFEYITQKQFTDLSKQTVSISVKLSNLIDYLQQSKKS